MKTTGLTLLFSLFLLISPTFARSIYVDGIIENNSLMPCIYINNHLVMKIPDKGAKGYHASHFERAQSIVKRLRQLESQDLPLERIYIRYSEKAYSAFIKGTRLYTISKGDERYFKKPAYSIAKMWRSNIKAALNNEANQNPLEIKDNASTSWLNHINEQRFWFKALISSLLIITLFLGALSLLLQKLNSNKIRAIECKLAYLEKKERTKD